MPVKDIQLHCFHAVQVSLENIEGRKVTARINQQTAPWETRLVLNRYRRSRETVGRDFNQLQKCLQAAKNPERICGVEFCSGGCNLEGIGFLLAQFLNFLAGVIGV